MCHNYTDKHKNNNKHMKISKITFVYTIIFLLATSISSQASTLNTNPKKNTSLYLHHNASLKNITLKVFKKNYTVQIFDIDGNLIKSYDLIKNTKLEVSTKDFKRGTYIVRYVGKSKRSYNSAKKLIIE